jgi:hypothetical protein
MLTEFNCQDCVFQGGKLIDGPCKGCRPGLHHGTSWVPKKDAAKPGAIYQLPEGVNLEDIRPGPLTGSIDATLNERGKRYGKFKDHARISQALKTVIANNLPPEQFARFSDDQIEALDMICHKLARIINGDPNYADSWVDIAGYAKLVADRLEGVER